LRKADTYLRDKFNEAIKSTLAVSSVPRPWQCLRIDNSMLSPEIKPETGVCGRKAETLTAAG
ncbi:hypothetical protein, partial [Rhizobium leguminosarum]|uniref:hypothetical protein n=1 Tax=Rhizobium leguminosarum TaxID=384 RepID=UPI003F977152